ncbi:MAG: type II toxin-antitoxin system RelE/ParE family toxin [Rickettsiales bacterium]
MIVSFADKETESFWLTGKSRTFPADVKARAFRKLQLLDAAVSLDFLRVPPSNQLEKLKGDRKYQYSIRVNQQWRLCFIWKDNEAHNVTFIDYH